MCALSFSCISLLGESSCKLFPFFPCPIASSHEEKTTSPLAQNFVGAAIPSVGMAQQVPPVIVQPQLQKKMLIRTDVHFDIVAREMTAVFELPGLKKHDLNIKMHVCPYSRVRQLLIMGRLQPTLPVGIYTIQERKFGDFYRAVVVPLDTKVSSCQKTFLLSQRNIYI